ncbi:sugar-binding domain-containing protein [Bacillus licheniformis]|nr:sugar-binding domain-containing protein [Bacillus licheniformis]
MDTKYHVNSIVYSIAGDFGGTPYFIDAAAVVEKRNEGGNRQVPLFQKIERLWNGLTVAAVGIGAPLSSSNMIWTGFTAIRISSALKKTCSRRYMLAFL